MRVSPQSHRIGRLSLRLSAASEAEALGLRAQLRQGWEGILPALGAKLDQLIDSGQWLHLPRLELRLRAASSEELLAILPELLARAIDERLRVLPQSPAPAPAGADRLVPTGSGAASGPVPGQDPGDGPGDGPRDGPGRDHLAGGADVLMAAAAVPLDTLLAYLEHGALPWFATHAPPRQDAWRSELSVHFATLLARLPAVASYELWCRLLPLLDGPQSETLVRARAAQQSRLQPVEAMLLRLARACGDAPAESPSQRGLRHLLASVLADSPSPLQQRRQQDESLQATLAGGPLEDAELAQLHELADAAHGPSGASVPAQSPVGEARLQHCVGLVLLHPYLPRLFSNTGIGWTAAGVEPAGLDRAAALLGWLATGDPCPAEHQLGFVKILLGLSPETPLPLLPGLLAQADLDEAGALLQSLIAHWTALGRISPDGLRQSFLQRSGLVRNVGNGWLLQVERTGYDLLLDRLPFAWSLVKLPWLTRPIHVEW